MSPSGAGLTKDKAAVVMMRTHIKGAAEVEDDMDDDDVQTVSPCSIMATSAPMEPSPLQLPNAFPRHLGAAWTYIILTLTLVAAATSAVLLINASVINAPPDPEAPTVFRRRCIDETTCWTMTKRPHAPRAPSSTSGRDGSGTARGMLRAWRSSLFSPPKETPRCGVSRCIDPMTCWSQPEELEQTGGRGLDYRLACDGWDASITCWSGWPLSVPGAAGHVLII
jgi:hypothetical protein